MEHSIHKQKSKKDKPTPLLDKTEPQKINIIDITLLKDEPAAEERAPVEFSSYVIEHMFFKCFMIFVVVASCVVTAVQADPTTGVDYQVIFFMSEYISLTIFIWEILLKWYNGFSTFWMNGWNILDFLITMAWILGSLFMPEGEHSLVGVFRVIRLLRWLSSIDGFSLIINVILRSLPDIGILLFFLMLIMMIFAVLGAIVFQEAAPSVFGDLMSAIHNLFICFTQDGWLHVYQEFEKGEETIKYGATVYFFIFIVGASFIFANILVAVIHTNLEIAIGGDETNMGSNRKLDKKKIIHVKKVATETNMYDKQIPWTDSCPGNISLTKIPILLLAMRKNQKSCQEIQQELQKIADHVHSLAPNRERDEEVLLRQQQSTLLREKILDNEIAAGRTGDILSTLLTLQNANIIDTGGVAPHLTVRGFGRHVRRQMHADESATSSVMPTVEQEEAKNKSSDAA